MRKLLKSIAAVLSLTVLSAGLSACGDNGSGSTPSSSDNSKTPESSVASTPETKTHSLKILGPDPGNKDIKYSEREEYEVWQALQDMLKENGLELDIEAVPNDQYEVVIQTRMASSDLPDIANCSNIDDASLVALGQNGTIQELGSAIAQYSNGNIDHMYTEVYDSGYPLIKTEDGKIYWLTNLHKGATFEGKEASMGLGLQLRNDWLSSINREMPTTLAEFTDTIRAFREQDVNGNGQNDEIILIDAQTFANGLAQIFGLGNGLVALDPVNGKIVSPWYQDNIQEYFTYLKSLIDEGLVDPATIGSWDIQNQRLAENLVGAWYAYDSATYLNGYVTNGTEGVDYEPIFTLTDAVEGSTPWKEVETAQLVWDRYCMTKACTDVEGAIKFFDMIYSEEYGLILCAGIEGKDYEIKDGVRTSLINGMTNAEKAAARRTTGSPLWGGLLPRVQLTTEYPSKEAWEQSLKESNHTDIQIDAMGKAVDYKQWCPLMINNFLAMATEEETETLNKIQTGLQTYSDEMCMKLALGTESLDNFDKIIEELKDLGLDDLISVQQARYDRFVANQK
ncbi:MAG: extracellular solute-binding protein [Candidatus Merdivicinus sp.]|jgi:putative aldouronate transport system substrate-binding protein